MHIGCQKKCPYQPKTVGTVGMKSCNPEPLPFRLLFKRPSGISSFRGKTMLAVSVFGAMEKLTDGVNNLKMSDPSIKKNRIQVSNTKKPLFFYVNLAKVLSLLILEFFLNWLLITGFVLWSRLGLWLDFLLMFLFFSFKFFVF